MAVGAGRIVLVDEVDAPEVGIAGEAGFGEAVKQAARYDAVRREGWRVGLDRRPWASMLRLNSCSTVHGERRVV